MTLTLGYKASAEQFAPRELVEIAVAAEAHGIESVCASDHFQPWRHEGGHAPFSLTWMAAVGERTRRIRIGTSVMTPTFRYNPAVHRAGVRDAGLPLPGPHHARRRHRRGAQRDRDRIPRCRRAGLARVQGALRAPPRGRRAHARAVDGRPGQLRGRVLLDPRRLHLRPPGRPRSPSTSPPAAPSWRSTRAVPATASSAPPARAWSSTPRSSSRPCKEGAEQAERDYDDIDRMIEIKLTYDDRPGDRPREHPLLGAASP